MDTDNKFDSLPGSDHPPLIKWLVVIVVLLLVIVAGFIYVQNRNADTPDLPDNGDTTEVTAADRERMAELLDTPRRPVTATDRARMGELLSN